MENLKGKKILIGICGGIAAYKVILLIRLIIKEGAEVRVIMTESAKQFVSPLVISTLSKNRVYSGLVENGEWINHVALGRWADLFLVAPLTCNTLSKMATGTCDNLFMAIYLSSKCQVVVAPAMDEDMWHHPATQRNIKTVMADGVKVIDVQKGELASGLFGEGRMAEPDEIFKYIQINYFGNDLKE